MIIDYSFNHFRNDWKPRNRSVIGRVFFIKLFIIFAVLDKLVISMCVEKLLQSGESSETFYSEWGRDNYFKVEQSFFQIRAVLLKWGKSYL